MSTCRFCALPLSQEQRAEVDDILFNRRNRLAAASRAQEYTGRQVSERMCREHRAHVLAPVNGPAEFPGLNVMDAVDKAVDRSAPTTEAWLRDQGIDTPAGLVAATVKFGDHWLRVKPEQSSVFLPESDVAALRSQVAAWDVKRADVAKTAAHECSFLVNFSDMQLGKGEGGGVKATVERFTTALARAVERFHELVAAGRNITEIVIANLGDPIEGIAGNYANQTFTVELNQRDQLNLCLDLWLAALRTLVPLAPKARFVSVLCNHGNSWVRSGGKSPITDDSDNAGAFLADTVRRVLEHVPGFEHVVWDIARDEMIVPVTIAGVPVAFSHGHTIKGVVDKWCIAQAARQREALGQVRLWVMGHRHHVEIVDCGPWWIHMAPTLDGGSKWLLDQSGQWSTPGVLTELVGTHDIRGWSDLAVL